MMLTKRPLPRSIFLSLKFYTHSIAWMSCFVIICGVLSIHAIADSHSQLPKIPCNIRLIFETDKLGMPSVAYKLGLQVRNRVARHITGVSVYWLDGASTIIGNSNAICGATDAGIGPSETGHCEKIVQQIGGNLLRNLGQTTWTEIINQELNDFKQVKQCAIVGYDYYDHQPEAY